MSVARRVPLQASDVAFHRVENSRCHLGTATNREELSTGNVHLSLLRVKTSDPAPAWLSLYRACLEGRGRGDATLRPRSGKQSRRSDVVGRQGIEP